MLIWAHCGDRRVAALSIIRLLIACRGTPGTRTPPFDYDTEPIAKQGNFSPQKGASSAFPYHLVVITVGELDSLDLEGFLPLNSSGIFPSTLTSIQEVLHGWSPQNVSPFPSAKGSAHY
jgi:hypothetical protein